MSGRTVTLYLARHGETAWNLERRWQGHTDTPLNDTGRAQARELAARARSLGVTAVGSSDLARARETARIVAEALGPGVALLPPYPSLRERGFGGFEGLTADECAERFPEAWERYRADARHCPPDAEPHDVFRRRVVDAVVRAASEVPAHALIVAHGGVLRALAADPTCAIPNACVFRVVVELGDGVAEVERV